MGSDVIVVDHRLGEGFCERLAVREILREEVSVLDQFVHRLDHGVGEVDVPQGDELLDTDRAVCDEALDCCVGACLFVGSFSTPPSTIKSMGPMWQASTRGLAASRRVATLMLADSSLEMAKVQINCCAVWFPVCVESRFRGL